MLLMEVMAVMRSSPDCAAVSKSVPLLLRLHRRFGTWRAPVLGLAVFTGMFFVSAFITGPAPFHLARSAVLAGGFSLSLGGPT